MDGMEFCSHPMKAKKEAIVYSKVHNKGCLQGGDLPQSRESGSNDKSAATIEAALLNNEQNRDQGSGFVNDVK
jgi:hypothetical protein